MQQYQLSQTYAKLVRALAQDEIPLASELLGQILGFELPQRPRQWPWSQRPDGRVLTEKLLSYRGFKPAELAMLGQGIKPVVKFEDIPLAHARAFVDRFAGTYQVEVTAPYAKDYLILRSKRSTAGVPRDQQLVCIYASRGDQGRQLRALEQSRREDAGAAGKLLGFPHCCVQAFVADFAHSRQDQDTVNDDACRRALTQGPTPQALLNPLSDLELASYYPCRLDCAEALKQARRNRRALLATAPKYSEILELTLSRPVLYWRLPLFAALDGAWLPGPDRNQLSINSMDSPIFRLDRVWVNAFADAEARAVQLFFTAHLSDLIGDGDGLQAQDDGVHVLKGPTTTRVFPKQAETPALLIGWSKAQHDFFDPKDQARQPNE